MTKVLIVDDEPQIVRALSTNLTVRGYEVETAATGEEAIALASRARPDLLIVDLDPHSSLGGGRVFERVGQSFLDKAQHDQPAHGIQLADPRAELGVDPGPGLTGAIHRPIEFGPQLLDSGFGLLAGSSRLARQ